MKGSDTLYIEDNSNNTNSWYWSLRCWRCD